MIKKFFLLPFVVGLLFLGSSSVEAEDINAVPNPGKGGALAKVKSFAKNAGIAFEAATTGKQKSEVVKQREQEAKAKEAGDAQKEKLLFKCKEGTKECACVLETESTGKMNNLQKTLKGFRCRYIVSPGGTYIGRSEKSCQDACDAAKPTGK